MKEIGVRARKRRSSEEQAYQAAGVWRMSALQSGPSSGDSVESGRDRPHLRRRCTRLELQLGKTCGGGRLEELRLPM